MAVVQTWGCRAPLGHWHFSLPLGLSFPRRMMGLCETLKVWWCVGGGASLFWDVKEAGRWQRPGGGVEEG